MDIDDFLDKAIGQEPNKSQKTPTSVESVGEGSFSFPEEKVQKKDPFHVALETIQQSIHANKVQKIVEAYAQLEAFERSGTQNGNLLPEETLKIIQGQNKNIKLYLHAIIQKSASDMQEIQGLIKEAQSFIAQSDLESAQKIYKALSDILREIPDNVDHHKIFAFQQVNKLGLELQQKKYMQDANTIKTKGAQIIHVLQEGHMYIDKRDLHTARMQYDKAMELFAKLPQGYFMQKITLHERLLELHMKLSVVGKISSLQSELAQMREQKQ